MTEYFYLDVNGQLLGSLMACSFSDAHSWLAHQRIPYHSVTKFRPRVRKGRGRRLKLASC